MQSKRFLKTTLFILRKDLRHYWILVSCLYGFSLVGTLLQVSSLGMLPQNVVSSLAMIAMGFTSLVATILIVMAVQSENLADPNIYWMSKPISRKGVLLSKFLFAFIVASVPVLIQQCIVLVLNDGTHRVPYAIAEIIPGMVYAGFLIFPAAQAKSLARFLLIMVCAWLVVWLVSMVYMLLLSAFSNGSGNYTIPGVLPDHLDEQTVNMVQTLYWAFGVVMVLVFLYQTRRFVTSWCLVGGIWAFSFFLSSSDDMSGNQMFDEFGTFNDSQMELELVENTLFEASIQKSVQGDFRNISALFDLKGVEASESAWFSVQYCEFNQGSETFFAAPANYYQLGEVTNRVEDGQQILLNLCTMQEQANRFNSERAFDANLSIQVSVSKEKLKNIVSLKEGEKVLNDGDRLVIRGMERSDEEVIVFLEALHQMFTFEPLSVSAIGEPLNGQYSFALKNRKTGNIQRGKLEHSFALFGGIGDSAMVRFDSVDDSLFTDYELLIFRREIQKQDQFFLNLSDVFLRRSPRPIGIR